MYHGIDVNYAQGCVKQDIRYNLITFFMIISQGYSGLQGCVSGLWQRVIIRANFELF